MSYVKYTCKENLSLWTWIVFKSIISGFLAKAACKANISAIIQPARLKLVSLYRAQKPLLQEMCCVRRWRCCRASQEANAAKFSFAHGVHKSVRGLLCRTDRGLRERSLSEWVQSFDIKLVLIRRYKLFKFVIRYRNLNVPPVLSSLVRYVGFWKYRRISIVNYRGIKSPFS